MLTFLEGYKTYLAAAGLVGLAVYQFSQGNGAVAVQSLMAALAAFGVRRAIAKAVEPTGEPDTLPMPSPKRTA